MEETRRDLGGMTVNERLFEMRLIDQWDAAVLAQDREKMLEIMRRLEVDSPEYTVDTILANPAKYGF
jgi:hypothetical protein